MERKSWIDSTKDAFLSCFKMSLIFTLVFSFFFNEFKLEYLLFTFAMSSLYSFSLGFGNGGINYLLDKKWDWLLHTQKRVYFGIFFTILFTVPTVLLINYFVFMVYQDLTLEQFFSERMLFLHFFYIVLSLGVSVFMHAQSFMLKWKEASKMEITQQKIIVGNVSAKFESLKNQLDPHFLFNSLNVLSSLIEENPDLAQKFTTSLSKVYRYVLEQKDKEIVSVKDELLFAKTYMNLLKMRFENSLFFTLPETIPDDLFVVPLSLQLLLENAVKHNVVSDKQPLHICISIENGLLSVQNNLQKKAVVSIRKGVGIQNIVDRYALLTKKNVMVEENKLSFAVKIPMLKESEILNKNTPDFSELMNDNAYFRAKKRVEQLRGFYINLLCYSIVIPVLVFVNLTFLPKFHWFWYSAGGWGFGLFMHGIQVFAYNWQWEQKKINEILTKMN